jgi:hypothetical protein
MQVLVQFRCKSTSCVCCTPGGQLQGRGNYAAGKVPRVMVPVRVSSMGCNTLTSTSCWSVSGPINAACPRLPSLLLTGGAPELLAIVLEGESLFNDASSIVLFEIFLKLASSSGPLPGARTLLPHIAGEVAWLAGAGAVGGLIAGLVTRWVWVRVTPGDGPAKLLYSPSRCV